MIVDREVDLLFAPDEEITIPTTVRNVGNSAAVNVRVEVVLQFLRVGREPTFAYPIPPQNFQVNGYFLPQDSPRTFQFGTFKDGKTKVWKGQWADAYRNSESYISEFGKVSYSDIFGNLHWTQFCMHFGAEGADKDNFEKCAAYNQMSPVPEVKEPPPISCDAKK